MNETRFFLRDPEDGSLHRPASATSSWGSYYLPACNPCADADNTFDALALTADQYQEHNWKYGVCKDCYDSTFDIEPAKPMRWSYDLQRVGWWEKVQREDDTE